MLFLVKSTDEQVRGIYVVDANGGAPTRILPDESMGIPVGDAAGMPRVVFVRGTTLLAQRLNASSYAPSGEPIVLAERIALGLTVRRGAYSASSSTLVYRVDATFAPTRVQWLDRAGRQVAAVDTGNASVSGIALSPDESTVVFGRFNRDTNTFGVWLSDRARATSRLLSAPPFSIEPAVWSPDGRTIAIATNQSGLYRPGLLTISGEVTAIKDAPIIFRANYWTSDGKFLVGTGGAAVTTVVSVDGSSPPRRLAAGRYPTLSPDGRWLAYTSSETGRDEVYLQQFADGGQKTRVSTAGGFDSKWRGDGRELFYLSTAGDVMAVPIRTASTVEIGTPAVLFMTHMRPDVDSTYAVTKDGQRFLVNLPSTTPTPLVAVVNWLGDRAGSQ